MKKTRLKKIGKIVSDILLYLFLAICVSTLILAISAKKDSDGASELFGYQMRIISSDSMAKCELTDVSDFKIGSIPLRSMVFVKIMPENEIQADEWYGNLKVGDVLTFRYVYTNQVTITHRVVSIEEKPLGGFLIELAGDNKNSNSGQLTQIIDTSIENNTNYVIGKVTGQCFVLGVIVSLLKTPLGIIFVIIVPCFIIILLEIIKIIGAFSVERKKQEQEEKQQKDNEIEQLRRRLAELEVQKVESLIRDEVKEIQ